MFEDYFSTARQDIYDLVCGLYAYDQKTDKTKVSSDFNGGHQLLKYSKVTPLKCICATLNCVDTCIDVLYINFSGRCVAYQ